MQKFQAANDVAEARKPVSHVAFRPLYQPTADHRRRVFEAIKITAESDGFSAGESFALAVASLARSHDATNIAEGAARAYAQIVGGITALPEVARPAGSYPSLRWIEVEAMPRWSPKSFDGNRAA